MAETAKDMVKKDLKKDKLKVPELDEKTKTGDLSAQRLDSYRRLVEVVKR